jgi:phosphotransferase system enzyme I (PtsI)
MKHQGIGASPGIAIAPAYVLESQDWTVKSRVVSDPTAECNRLLRAVETAVDQLRVIRDATARRLDEEHAMIFDAHIQMASDPEIRRQAEAILRSEHINAEAAYQRVTDQFHAMFEAMDDPYFKERASDILDVRQRVLAALMGRTLLDPSTIDHDVIVVAEDLTPSVTAQLPKQFVQGFVTRIGGRTSHSAIMARSLELPAVVGVEDILQHVQHGDTIAMDGTTGVVLVRPSSDLVDEYQSKQIAFQQKRQRWETLREQPTRTADGHVVELAANIGSPDDMPGALRNGAEGIGLYRTEFLYMNNSELPSEDAQYQAYKTVLEQLPTRNVVIRTLDIGGDKQLPYLKQEPELNPFLGHRALRLCLEKTDLFKTQLRALLRAGVHGNLHIMFPMVATLDELRQAKNLVQECISELMDEGIPYAEDVKIGIMVEIPSVAVLADQFAKEVDFFSIGTNDLIQYTFAAGRMNDKVAYLYQPYHPALLRLIKGVIDAAHANGIWAGMCGEVAGDPLAAPILLGLGLDEFSMSAASILQMRERFSTMELEACKNLAEHCLSLSTNDEVKDEVERFLQRR